MKNMFSSITHIIKNVLNRGTNNTINTSDIPAFHTYLGHLILLWQDMLMLFSSSFQFFAIALLLVLLFS